MNSRLWRALAGATLLITMGCMGCAQRRSDAVVATPQPEELTPMPQVEPVAPVTVAVEGRRELPVMPLLPPFPDPGPTPEERRILGLDVPQFRFLEYPNAVPPPASRPVGSFVGGPTVGIGGLGGQVSGVAGARPKSGGVYGSTGGASTGVLTHRPQMAGGTLQPTGPTGEVGPNEGGARVETDPRAKQISGRNRRRDR